jgi:FMN reductase
MTTIAVVTAGLTQPSSTRLLGDQLAAAVRDVLAAEAVDTEIVTVDLRDHAHDLTNNLLTGFPAAALRAVIDQVTSADAVIAVTPTFSASYSGLFKMFFDVLDEGALAGKPVLMAATGGTERHSLVLEYALRPMFSYLQAIVVPTGVYAATSDFGSGQLRERTGRAATELVGLLRGRRAEPERDPYDEPTPFEQLLAN